MEKSITADKSKWEFINIPKMLQEKFPQSYWLLSDDEVKKEAELLLNIDFLSVQPNPQSAIFVATDGAHEREEFKTATQSTTSSVSKNETSAAFVLCIADMDPTQNGNSISNMSSWEDKTSIPLLCRTASLPAQLGTDNTDVAHGEAFAIAMQEWSLPHCIPRILITDSESVRNVCLNLRNQSDNTINRKLIRTILGGISKTITSDLHQHLNKSSFHKVNASTTTSNLNDSSNIIATTN